MSRPRTHVAANIDYDAGMYVLIDGYNLIFQCGLEGRSAATDALEKARGRLLNELAAHLSDQARQNTTIVFDAKTRPVKEVPETTEHHGIQVLFAVDYEDADANLESLIRKHSVPKQLTVVSSDHRIQTAAKRRKATPVDSDVWYEQLMTGQLESGNEAEEEAPPKPPQSFENPFPPGYGEDLLP